MSHIDPKVADYTHEELVRFRAPGYGPIDVVPKDQFEAVEDREEQEVDPPSSPAVYWSCFFVWKSLSWAVSWSRSLSVFGVS